MFVIYNKETTKFLRIIRHGYWQDAKYETFAAAKAGMTRQAKKDPNFKAEDFAIIDAATFHRTIEKQEVKHNLLSGKPFVQPVNTPLCCDPSSETYWSM